MKNDLRCLPAFLLMVFLLFASAGCAPKRGDISGAVSYQGKPVCSGSVNVEANDGAITGGEIQADGTYQVKDVLVGQIRVTVFSPDPGNNTVIARKPQDIPAAKDRSKWFRVPEHFADFNKSGLAYEVKPGPNSINIELK